MLYRLIRPVQIVLLIGAVVAFTAACAANKVSPQNPTPQQQAAKLGELQKIADASVTIESLARDLQNAEISAYQTKTISALTDVKHREIQQAFKTFFETSKDAIKTAQDLSTPDGTRRDAVAKEITGANTLLGHFGVLHSAPLSAFLVALETAVLSVNLVI